MAFVPANGVVKVDIRQSLYGQQVSNTLYFRKPSGGMSVPEMEVLTGLVAGWYADELAPQLVDSLTLVEVYATDLTAQDAPTYTHIPGVVIAGDKVQPGLPSNVSYCVSFRTSGRGRSSRGRNYVAGLSENDVAGNILDAGVAGSIVGAYNVLNLTVGAGGEFEHVVVSTMANKEYRDQALVQPVVVCLGVDNTVDSQRRRLTGRGR